MANFSFNKVIIGGRLSQEPELKTTPGGHSVVSFSIAVNRKHVQGKEQETDFFNVTAWRQTAEHISRYFHKGSSICIVGSLQNSSWTNQKGEKQFRTDIIADEVMFVDSKSERTTLVPTTTNAPMPKFEDVPTDADLPF